MYSESISVINKDLAIKLKTFWYVLSGEPIIIDTRTLRGDNTMLKVFEYDCGRVTLAEWKWLSGS